MAKRGDANVHECALPTLERERDDVAKKREVRRRGRETLDKSERVRRDEEGCGI